VYPPSINLFRGHELVANTTVVCDEKVSATRVHTNILQPEPQPYVESGVCVWLDGEFYNCEELGRSLGITPTNDPALLLELYHREDFLSLLKRIDGI
jgi:asparagine synthase (glutamine-hydrolysing)